MLQRMPSTLCSSLEGDALLTVVPPHCLGQVLGTSEATGPIRLLPKPEGSHTTERQRTDCAEKDPGSKNPVHHYVRCASWE